MATTLTLLFGSHWPILLRILGPLGLVVAGSLIETVVLWRAARRLMRTLPPIAGAAVTNAAPDTGRY